MCPSIAKGCFQPFLLKPSAVNVTQPETTSVPILPSARHRYSFPSNYFHQNHFLHSTLTFFFSFIALHPTDIRLDALVSHSFCSLQSYKTPKPRAILGSSGWCALPEHSKIKSWKLGLAHSFLIYKTVSVCFLRAGTVIGKQMESEWVSGKFLLL